MAWRVSRKDQQKWRVACPETMGCDETEDSRPLTRAPVNSPPAKMKRISYAAATTAGWWFATTGDWQCYAWRVRGPIVDRTPRVPVGGDADIGQHYRNVLALLSDMLY